ncbi:hypothetical protein MMMB2_3787 [Mycobacterium marinum MB2]|nr:hypothetical protein MMMB2_3787 [Mycobacterium marinum MB2]
MLSADNASCVAPATAGSRAHAANTAPPGGSAIGASTSVALATISLGSTASVHGCDMPKLLHRAIAIIVAEFDGSRTKFRHFYFRTIF